MVEFFARTMAQDRERNIRYFNEYGMYCMFGQACVHESHNNIPSDPAPERSRWLAAK